MTENQPAKAVVTVSEMARMCGLSRSRFYQLIGSAFPTPSRDPQTGRPFYDADQQQTCLEVRKRNCGIDGKPILFYARRTASPTIRPRSSQKPKPTPAKSDGRLTAILDGVRALGLVSATERQVEQVVRELFPDGTASVGSGELIRAVFVALMRRNPADNHGR